MITRIIDTLLFNIILPTTRNRHHQRQAVTLRTSYTCRPTCPSYRPTHQSLRTFTFSDLSSVASWQDRAIPLPLNFGLSENFSSTNATFQAENSPISEKFQGKIKILGTRDFLCRKLCRKIVLTHNAAVSSRVKMTCFYWGGGTHVKFWNPFKTKTASSK